MSAVTREFRVSELDEAIAEVAFLEALCDGLATGLIGWAEVMPELTCGNRQETAYREYEQRLDEARERLTALRADIETGN